MLSMHNLNLSYIQDDDEDEKQNKKKNTKCDIF